MRTLYDGTCVPTTIDTNERVFQVETFDGETVLCNVRVAKVLLPQTKVLKHLYNNKFLKLSKLELKEM